MGRFRETAWPALAVMLLASCSGGGDEALSATVGKPTGADGGSPSTNLVVVRYDRDRDSLPDLLTLDASRNPLVIVEAIRGTADGGGVDVTDTWRGGEIEPVLNDAMQHYLTESLSVGSRTDIELVVDGQTVTVTVIE